MKKKPINSMEYAPYRDRLRGYSIRARDKNNPVQITKIMFFWTSTDDEILDLFNGKNRKFELYDTPGWENGFLRIANFYSRDMVYNRKRLRA